MKSQIITSMLALGLIGFMAIPSVAQEPETREQYEARMAWFREARFGLFIHWGPVAIKGANIGWTRGDEIKLQEYDNLYKRFNPVKFNADEWAKIAKDAGMKYLVLVTKHHDGFCLWDTKATDYNIMNSPFKRDVTKELAEACRKQGIVYCSYYSILDWWHPNYPVGRKGPGMLKPNMPKYFQYMKTQLTEQLTNYGPIGVMWFDGAWESPWTHDQAVDLYNHLRKLQPNIIINNRVDKGDGFKTTGFVGDYATPEQSIGNFNMDRPWESCITICTQWSWKPKDKMKSLKECIQTLLRTVGGDGNLLFNVGPMPTGEIEPRQVERLKEMGAWLAKYGKTVYGTRGGPFKPGKFGISTRKDKNIYVHIMAWEGDKVTLPAIPARIVASSAMTGGKVTVKQTDAGIEISLPAEDRQEIDTVIMLELDKPAMEIPAK
ncbi:MAG: alpha-L-fucosidase [Planctomycetota bacterium]